MPSELIVFDGDDTLWLSEPLYDEARARARAEVESAGLDGSRWEALERDIDVRNVARFGLASTRFPTSCVEAYETLATELGAPVDQRVAEAIYKQAQTVFSSPAPPVPEAFEVLSALQRSHALALLTQGDPRVQRRRLARSDLEEMFDVMVGVTRKTAESFQYLLDHFGVAAWRSWSVGNSLPSDINPALSIGMKGIWIPRHVWEYERRESEKGPGVLAVATTLAEVPAIIAHEDDAGGKAS